MKIYKLLLLLAVLLFACKANIGRGKVTIHTIGDSTMANKPNPDINPERGWVQVLAPYFNENVQIKNYAVNGRSTKSFRERGHWQPVLDALQPGDYVFIQFGHNDGKETDPERYTNPQTSYRYNLIRYIEEARSKGAVPILFSSIARRKFNKEGVLLDAHGNYTLVARLVASELKVPFFDMQYLTENLEMCYGVEGSKKLHLHFAKGDNEFFPDGIDDNTHLSVLGANEIAKIFVSELKRQKHPLQKYLNE